MNSMTSKQRVELRLKGLDVDKIPNLNILMSFAARYGGSKYKAFATDFHHLVECNIQCCLDFGIDIVSTMSDPYRETHGFGARIDFPDDDIPLCNEIRIKNPGDIRYLHAINPVDDIRMHDRIQAIDCYKTRIGKEFPILGWVEGAFAEAADLLGLGSLMLHLFDNPDSVHELLEICTEQAIWFAVEQIRAGADIVGIGDAAASLIGPLAYYEFVLPYETRIIDAIHQSGAKAKLHICGNVTNLLAAMGDSKADIIDIDSMVDFKMAHEVLGNQCSLCGNFDPVGILLQGNRKTITEAIDQCIANGNDKTFIAAGCEVPKMTPKENLIYANDALGRSID